MKRDEIKAIKFETAQIHFLCDVFAAVAGRCCLSPLWSNGQITRDPAQLPNVFNDLFSTVGPKLASMIRTSNRHFSGFLPPREFANSCGHLTWKPHIDNVAITVKTIGVIARLKRFVARSTLLNLYRSLIFPYLYYGLIAWGQAS